MTLYAHSIQTNLYNKSLRYPKMPTTHPKRTSRFLQKETLGFKTRSPPTMQQKKKHLPKTIMRRINVKPLNTNYIFWRFFIDPPAFAAFNSHTNLPTKIPDQWFSRISCFRSLMDKLNGRVNSYTASSLASCGPKNCFLFSSDILPNSMDFPGSLNRW